jgi:peptide-methionine (S)-S-oxide reductase
MTDQNTATFGAGCFWGVQAAFDKLEGVTRTEVGYQGGSTENPTYEQVCRDDTGHAEAVRVQYDPNTISYEQLLNAFFDLHDPTQRNRQGPDIGSQYRSVIFPHDENQRAAAEAKIEQLNRERPGNREVATTIEPNSTFYPAEDYHQKYLEKRGAASCRVPGLG